MVKLNFIESKSKKKHRGTKMIFVFFIMLGLVATPLTAAMAKTAEEQPYPAPTLVSPTDGKTITETKPLITGLSLNKSLVKVFVDGRLNGQFMVKSHESGVSFSPFFLLCSK